ncbi:MAG: ABC transporter substrate-binding protein [Alphaproteobacteria bacterium]
MSSRAFMRDCADIAADAFNAGRLDRRTFLRICALAGVTPVILRSGEAAAEVKEIVIANWGGDAVRYYDEAWGQPFTKKTGIEMAIDGTGPTDGKIKAMVESGNVIWDACDADLFTPLRLGRQGLLEPIDYAVVDRNKARPGYAYEYGIISYYYSYVLAYDREAFGDNPPKSWADFWDVERFPGKRSFYKWMNGAPEAALMADGVPPDQVYPLDLDRALRKIEELKPHIAVYWASGSESQQMFREREVTMGAIWHTRANLLEKETGGRVTWTWNQGNAGGGCWVVPKGNPAGTEVNRLIAFMQIPETQIHLLATMGNGPANPEATAKVPSELRRVDPGQPENWEVQVPMSAEYFAEHYDEALNAYLDLISA